MVTISDAGIRKQLIDEVGMSIQALSSNSSSGTTSVVTVSDINNVQNKVSVRDNNTSL